MVVATTTATTNGVQATAVKPVTVNKPVVKNRPVSIPLAVQLLTAGSAACIADIMTFPLDTVKVRLQVQGEAGSKAVMYNGVMRTVLGIARDEGPK